MSPEGPEPALVCKGLTKRFGSVTALQDLNLEVSRGTLVGLLGPNGAGKTTLIRILLGLTPATSGRASVLGATVPAPHVLSRIGYMPQNPAIYTDLRVGQNLELFGRLYGMPPVELARRTNEVLSLVRLADRRDARVGHLSGGMQRRVSLATALLTDPDLLLLDEPTVGVDPELRAEFWSYFRGLARAGRTVIMTTHYMEEATHCDSVTLLHEGRLLAHDDPTAIKTRCGAASLDEAFLSLVRAGSSGGHR
jgi:ABC-2 type transport system ATP-binding protein